MSMETQIRPVSASALLLGMGLGGFVDALVFPLALQGHHQACSSGPGRDSGGADRATLVLPPDLSAPRLARTWVRTHLNSRGLAEPVFEGIVVAVSELVTNVIVHTDSAPTLSIDVDPRRVRIEVRDRSGAAATMRTPEDDRSGGRGLRIVDHVADAWGTEEQPDGGKVVWFVVETP
jgi:anti-sigma regulatory factor (Ser/Thr protein kinase)